MNMTENEKSIMNTIATNECNPNNGSLPRTILESATWLFMDELASDSGLTVNQVKGVLGSLVKKGLLLVDEDEVESLVQFTQEGINFLWD